jgi:hypothetical protein
MGADMCVTALALDAGDQPDWAAGEQAIKELTVEALMTLVDDFALDCNTDYMQERLREALKNARRAVEGWNRECVKVNFGRWTLFLTGGMSCGDLPTDLFDDLWLLSVSGVAAATGFGWPTTDTERAPSEGAAR